MIDCISSLWKCFGLKLILHCTWNARVSLLGLRWQQNLLVPFDVDCISSLRNYLRKILRHEWTRANDTMTFMSKRRVFKMHYRKFCYRRVKNVTKIFFICHLINNASHELTKITTEISHFVWIHENFQRVTLSGQPWRRKRKFVSSFAKANETKHLLRVHRNLFRTRQTNIKKRQLDISMMCKKDAKNFLKVDFDRSTWSCWFLDFNSNKVENENYSSGTRFVICEILFRYTFFVTYFHSYVFE